MSRLLDLSPKQAIYIAGGIVAGAGIAYAGFSLYRKICDNRIPKKWKKVGEVSDLLCYPIKSCGWIRINEFNCSQIGLESGHLRDRVFMVIKNGEFITARGYPEMVQVQPTLNRDIMTLEAPGMIKIQVDIDRLYSIPATKAFVWGQEVEVIDAGEEVAQWLSRFLLKEDFGLRLVFYPTNLPTRDVREKNKIFETAIPEDTGSLHDATSFMLINEASVSDLNTRLKKKVEPLQFRPNIVVRGPGAYEEDSWKWIKIGNETVFRNVKPCTRCIFTNIDPETAERNPEEEPLKTLKKYRMFENCGDSPVMGIHLGIREFGNIRVNDSVYVEDYS